MILIIYLQRKSFNEWFDSILFGFNFQKSYLHLLLLKKFIKNNFIKKRNLIYKSISI